MCREAWSATIMRSRPGSQGPEEAEAFAESRIHAPWSRSERPVPRRIVRPLQSFLSTESAGGILLLAAALVALIWANSPWSDTYERTWHTVLTLRLGDLKISEDVRHWVNDGLMTLFFFVVGLEIKRELATGELRRPRAAALPAVAALGGMVVPAAIYAALNAGGVGSRGWGIPMATDIAFAVGVLTIAARQAPPSLKPFLLTLAIVDDIGAIIVIAIFYTQDISLLALGLAIALVAVVVALQRIAVRAISVYMLLGIGIWFAMYFSGVHPIIAGIVLGAITPTVAFQRPRAVSEEARRVADETVDDPEPPDADADSWLRLADLSREAVPPLARAEAAMHPWTSFLIVPVFALANAGVPLSGESLREATTSAVTLGVVLGLVLGKTVGITLASWIGVRTGLALLPADLSWRHVLGGAAVAGIGFTVSLFITDLAFVNERNVESAKVGIVAASVLAGVIGYLILAFGRAPDPAGDATASE